MVTLLTILHVIVCLFLIIVVLLQSGKAADLAGAFGGMGSQTAFGPRGAATVLSKATTTAAVLFMLTSISLGIMQGNRAGAGAESVIEKTGLTEGEGGGSALPAGSGVNTVPLPAPAPASGSEDSGGADGAPVGEVEVTPAEGGTQ